MYNEKFDTIQDKKTNPNYKREYLALLIPVLCIMLWITVATLIPSKPQRIPYDENAKAFATSSDIQVPDFYYAKGVIDEIKGIYDDIYIGEAPDTFDMVENAIAGAVSGTGDKYGNYLTPKQTIEYFNKMGCVTTGIGVTVAYEDNDDFRGLYITNVSKDSPAEQNGIKVGDYIVAVEGKTLNDISYEEFIERVKGPEGTQVTIDVMSKGITKTITISRKACKISTVDYRIDSNIGYIKISNFEQTTYNEFIDAITTMQAAGIHKYIFDLRDNSGGMVSSITSVLDYLLPEGLIVRIDDKTNEMVYNSDVNQIQGDMVVLTNQNTASAAELFTLALKDYDKAISIGERTFGKGTQVTTVPLSNGGSLILSSGKYYTKNSPNIEGVGIEPDIRVPLSADKQKILYRLPVYNDEQYQTAVKYLNSK